MNTSVMLNYWFWGQNYRFEGSRTICGALSSRQINSVSPESLVTSTVFITSDHLWDARDQLLIPNCLGNMAETNPDFRQQRIRLISVKTWNVIFLLVPISFSKWLCPVMTTCYETLTEVFPRGGCLSHWLRNSFTDGWQVPWELVSWKVFT